MEYDPTNPEAFQLMASCSLSQQNMDEARKMLEKSLELWQGKDEELPQVCAKWTHSRQTLSLSNDFTRFLSILQEFYFSSLGSQALMLK